MEFIINYLVGFIILISVLVFVHEMGHYLFAKLFKVKVHAFSIGFGKELFGFTDRSGTRWKFSLIPFGGYVKMKGEMISDNVDITDKESFENKNLLQKFLIVFAGPLFNLIFPILIIFCIIFFNGEKNYDATIGKVLENSPAYNILHSNDKIISINNNNIDTFGQAQQILQKHPNELVKIIVNRDNILLTFNIKLQSNTINNKLVGFLGVYSSNNIINTTYSFSKAIHNSYVLYIEITKAIITGLHNLITLNISLKDIGGPIKIAQIAGDSAKEGINNWLFIMSLISINLAVINLFPIPALDGGYLLLYLIQGITRKKISYKWQIRLIGSGFYLLILLMILIIFKDIIGLITGTL